MKFGLFYENQVPRPWGPDTEYNVFRNALDEIELADRLGYDHLWVVEHHFLEEYSHSSAPELFLAAASQRTKRMRLGHGIMHMPPSINHPARVAERMGTLDLLSGGRAEWGTGEGATTGELGGFNVEMDQKKPMWREATEQAANMMVMQPYPGFEGQYFRMPARNIVPKPMQRPHPPAWVACSRRESILSAARHGMGALVFGFAKPEQAAKWVEEYYEIICSDECVPLTHVVNPNIAIVTGLSVHPDQDEAIARGMTGFKFFGYSLGHYTVFGTHVPGQTDVWSNFMQVRDAIPDNHGQGGIGTPDKVRQHCKEYEEAGVDQLIFVQQCGGVQHEHICASLGLFAREVMPDFKVREEARLAAKVARLAPYIEAALARKIAMEPLQPDEIPTFKALGVIEREATGALQGFRADPTRGSGVSYLTEDPALRK